LAPRAENLLALPETELWVIGLVLTHGHMAAQAVARLNTEHFTVPGAATVWNAIRERVAAGKNVSGPAVFGDVRKDERARALVQQLIESPTDGWRIHHFDDLCEQLEMAAARRRVFRAAQELAKVAADGEYDDPVQLEVMAQATVWQAIRHTGQQDVIAIGDAAEQVVEEWEERAKGEPAPRVAMGFPRTLDAKLGGGLHRGDLYVLAARPHMGKTALALTIALNVGRREGQRVLYFSPEMDETGLAQRALQWYGIRSDQAVAPDMDTVMKAKEILQHLKASRIDIVPRRYPSVEDIAAKARAYALEHHDLALIIVDHLGEIQLPRGIRDEVEAVGHVVRALRNLAYDLKVPVLLLSQLNRKVEDRDDKRPRNADLRGSGRIEELADTIMFLYREAVYNEDVPEELQGVAEVIVTKNRRTGRLGPELIEFVPSLVRFQEAEPGTLYRYSEYLDEQDKKRSRKVTALRRETA